MESEKKIYINYFHLRNKQYLFIDAWLNENFLHRDVISIKIFMFSNGHNMLFIYIVWVNWI